MTDELDQLANWVGPLLASIQPAERRRLAGKIARDLRRDQTARIKTQQNPDGTPFAPRKPQRSQQGAIRRKAMFTRLRTSRYLKTRSTADAATVGFTGRVAQIARVHQQGLTARVDANGPRYDYPARELLGFTRRDRDAITQALLAHLKHAAL